MVGTRVTEHCGIGRLEEGHVVLQAPLGAVGLLQPVLELVHAGMVATLQVVLGLAELSGQVIGTGEL